MRSVTALLPLVLALALAGCKTTREKELDQPIGEGEEVHIPPGDLEPMASFLFETRRVLFAEVVVVQATTEFFERKMGFTRDLRFVERTQRTLPDGTRMIELRNVNTAQETNVDPDLLPRVYFDQGLEIRAYKGIRIYLHRPKDRRRPLFIDVQGRSEDGNAKMWVTGRLQYDQPTIRLKSELRWDENRERYVHVGAID